MSQGRLISEKVSARTQDTDQPPALGSCPYREPFLKPAELISAVPSLACGMTHHMPRAILTAQSSSQSGALSGGVDYSVEEGRILPAIAGPDFAISEAISRR
jgi:hypothetical protein